MNEGLTRIRHYEEAPRQLVKYCVPGISPHPFPWMCSDVSAHRIQNNVSGNLQQLTLLLDEDSLEPALEDMSQPLVGSVERLCIHTIQVAHATREIRIRRFDQQVIVIAHKAIGMADPSEALNDIPTTSRNKALSSSERKMRQEREFYKNFKELGATTSSQHYSHAT